MCPKIKIDPISSDMALLLSSHHQLLKLQSFPSFHTKPLTCYFWQCFKCECREELWNEKRGTGQNWSFFTHQHRHSEIWFSRLLSLYKKIANELYVNLIHKQQQTFSPRIMYRKANPTLCYPVFFSMIFRQFQANNCQNSGLEENFGWVRQRNFWVRSRFWPS